MPAPSLSALVRSCGPLPEHAVRWLAAGCAEALDSIHRAGLVHRDGKPSNVLISPDGPRVIDFGLARAAERIQLTVTRASVGTPAYMAPEQARDNRQATSASDIYALGATLLYAATGHAPYRGETVMDVLVRLATEPLDLTGLPPGLTDIVGACLERDPRNRPTSESIIARLAPDLADHDGSALLPPAALQLIDDYSPAPGSQSAAPLADVAGEQTFGSQPPSRALRGLPAGPAQAQGHRPAVLVPASRGIRRLLLAVAGVAAAAVLLGAGWLRRLEAIVLRTIGDPVPLRESVLPEEGRSCRRNWRGRSWWRQTVPDQPKLRRPEPEALLAASALRLSFAEAGRRTFPRVPG